MRFRLLLLSALCLTTAFTASVSRVETDALTITGSSKAAAGINDLKFIFGLI